MQGHDPGHADETQRGAGWGALLTAHVEEFGGFAALADELLYRLADVADAPRERHTVEKGLRRLAGRGSKPGGQYGRWVMRFLGVPPTTKRWLAWLGQYHSRFADLPTGLRLQQLSLWNRPPISESPQATWIQLGLASVWQRLGERERAREGLRRALRLAPRAGAAPVLEARLFHARLLSESERGAAEAELASAAHVLEDASLSATDRACYHARLEAQRVYLHLHPAADEPTEGPIEERADIAAAQACAQAIPADSGLAFVDFRRAECLAYCARAAGRHEQARALARVAAEHAADGGFVRFRFMALKLLASTWPDDAPERARALAHARRLARALEDEDLLQRAGEASEADEADRRLRQGPATGR